MLDEQTLDPQAMARLHRIGGNEFVIEMIELFLENAPQRLAAARSALADGDWATFHRSVHSLKSTSANLGARALQAAAAEAEAKSKEGSLDGAPALLTRAERAYGQAREQLLAERDRLRGG